MSVAEIVGQHLPYLRRYARALTGSQSAGDAYVGATLEALLADPSALHPGNGSKVQLFNIFTRVWSSMPINADAEPPPPVTQTRSENRIALLPSLPRQAFVLTALEGFSPDEGAAVLGVDAAEFNGLIEEAGRELAEQMATDVLIIEDESLIAMDLESLVESQGHSVVGVARTKTEAIEITRRRRPGLILADIQLADGSSGLDAVGEILQGFEVPVIFITAYPERLLTGHRPEPTFLIAKPFQPQHLRAVISQALFFEQKARLRPSTAA